MTKNTAKEDRLQQGIFRLIEKYELPIQEAIDVLLNEDYPPLEDGDLGDVIFLLEEDLLEDY